MRGNDFPQFFEDENKSKILCKVKPPLCNSSLLMGYELNSPQYFEYIHIFIKIFKLANINFLNLVFSIPKSTCPAEVSIIWWGQQCEFIKFLIFFWSTTDRCEPFQKQGQKTFTNFGTFRGQWSFKKNCFWDFLTFRHNPKPLSSIGNSR